MAFAYNRSTLPNNRREPVAFNSFEPFQTYTQEKIVYKDKIIYRDKEPDKKSAVYLDVKEDIETENDNERCSVCFTNKKSVLYTPCNHITCCNQCSRTLITKKLECPVCRTEIKQMINVYT